jgi:hypothetical protein
MGSTIVRLQVYSITVKLKNQHKGREDINRILITYFNLYNSILYKTVALGYKFMKRERLSAH